MQTVGKIKKAHLIYDIRYYKCYIYLLVLLVESNKKKIIKKYGVVQKLRGSTFWGRQNANWGGYMGSGGVAQTGDIVISFEL